MKTYLTIILGTLILLTGCEKKENFSSGESAEEKSRKEEQERMDKKAEILKELEFDLNSLKNNYGITINHYPGGKEPIGADISGLIRFRFNEDNLNAKEEDLIDIITRKLSDLGNLSDYFHRMGGRGRTPPGFEGKGNFYIDLSRWSLVSNFMYPPGQEKIRNEVMGWMKLTRNFYHSCEDKDNSEQHVLVSLIREENQMDSVDCLTLFDTVKDSTHLEIKIRPDQQGIINLIALRGMPLETLIISSDEPNTKVVLNLEGLERSTSLKELVIKNLLVNDLRDISNLKDMHTLTIDYPNLKRQLKNCPLKTTNSSLNSLCESLGF